MFFAVRLTAIIPSLMAWLSSTNWSLALSLIPKSMRGMLKKAASGVLALLPCSRTKCTLRASKRLRPCWTDFFEHSLYLMMSVLSGVFIGHRSELFNSPMSPFFSSSGENWTYSKSGLPILFPKTLVTSFIVTSRSPSNS